MVQPDDRVGLRIAPAKAQVFEQSAGAPRIE
jgi:hypothetical protein